MAKLIPYDVTGVEESGGGTGVKVKPGVRVAKIVRCEYRDQKKDGTPANDIAVALDFGSEFDWGFTYVGLSEAADWKLAEFVRSIGLKDKGKIDPEKVVGKFIRVKVNAGTYEGQYSPDMGKLMRPQPGDEELWAEGNGGVSQISSQGDGDGPDVEEGEGGDEPEASGEGDAFYREGQPDPDDPNETVGSYDDWPEEDLAAEAEDRGLTIPGGRGSKQTKIIKALREDDANVSGADDGDDDDAEGQDDQGNVDDYDEWDVDRLKQEWEERELGDLPKVRGSGAETRLKAKIIEELRKDDEANPFDA